MHCVVYFLSSPSPELELNVLFLASSHIKTVISESSYAKLKKKSEVMKNSNFAMLSK